MAQQVNQTQDTREMHLGIYVTGTDASASYSCFLLTGKDNMHKVTGTTVGKTKAAFLALKEIAEKHVNARGMTIQLSTNVKFLADEIKAGSASRTDVERLALYGNEMFEIYTKFFTHFKNMKDKLVIEKSTLALELAKADAYHELHEQKAMKEAAAIASSEEALEAQEA